MEKRDCNYFHLRESLPSLYRLLSGINLLRIAASFTLTLIRLILLHLNPWMVKWWQYKFLRKIITVYSRKACLIISFRLTQTPLHYCAMYILIRLYFICNFQEIDVSFNGCFPGNFSKMLRNAGTELQAEAVSSPLTAIRVKW